MRLDHKLRFRGPRKSGREEQSVHARETLRETEVGKNYRLQNIQLSDNGIW